MDNLVQTVAAGNLGPAFVQRVNVRINELDKELNELSKERDQLRREEECMADRELQVDTLAAMLSSLKDNFDVLSVHEKRTLIRLLVKKIVWDREDLHIFMDGG